MGRCVQGGIAVPASIPRPSWLLVAAVALGLVAVAVPFAAVRDAAAVLTLAAVVAACFDPDVLVVFLLAYLPFRTLVGAVGPLPLRFVADAAVLGVTLRLVLRHPQRLWPVDAVEALGLAFILYGLWATHHAHAHLLPALLEIRDLFLFWWVYVVLRRLAQAGDGPSVDRWWRALPLALAAISVIGAEGLLSLLVVHHYGPHPAPFLVPGAWLKEPITPVNRGRPYGWVNNPNVFGELGAMGFALAASAFSGQRQRIARAWPYLVVAAICVAMVVFSYSRSAWVAFGLLAVVELVGAQDLTQAALPGAAAVATALLILLVPHASHRMAAATAQPTVAASQKVGRIHTLKVAEELVRRRPLGTGLGTFGSGASQLFHQTVKGIPHTFYGDDNYAVLLVETGLPGLFLFVLDGLAVYWFIARARSPAPARRLTFGLFLAVTVLGVVGNSWEQLNLAVYPWLAFAALIGAGLAWAPEAMAPAAAEGGRPAEAP
jgi:O-antigen ligase